MSNPATQQKLQQAVRLHQAGRLREAEPLYRQVLAEQPNNPDALHLLGVLASQAGQPAMGAEFIRAAINLQPRVAAFHGSLGLALSGMGKLDEAILSYRHAISLDPNLAEAYSNLGNALRMKGQTDDAIQTFERALTKNPKDVLAMANLGIALKDKGRLDDATVMYRRAMSLNSNIPELHYNLGIALKLQGKLDDAIAAYQKAISLRPTFIDAHTNLGNALVDLRRHDEAIACYQRAIQIRPDHAEALYNLGVALKEKGELDAAVAAYERAISLRPHHSEAIVNLGNAYRDMAEIDRAMDMYRRALELQPNNESTWSNLLYAMYFHPKDDPQWILQEHLKWAKRFQINSVTEKNPHPNLLPEYRAKVQEGKLRIGFVSPDFREHCQSFFTIPLLENLDREKFHLVAYSNWPRPDAFTDRIRKLFNDWREIATLDDDRAAQLIRDDKIDILIDLTVHMAKNRLPVFAKKPATVQATWLGYPGTTGLRAIDFRLTDSLLDPPGDNVDALYVEKTIRLSSFWCYRQPLDEPVAEKLPLESNGFLTFGCFNNFCKVTSITLDLWAKTMLAVKNSRLLILADRGAHRHRTLEAMKSRGVDPSRIEFLDKRPPREYLKLYHRVDICLDTFPTPGHTTTLDALWMGVPIATLVGRTALARGGLSILTNLGLPEFVAHTQDDYVKIIAELAADRSRLLEIRKSRRERMSKSILTDGPRFAKEFGNALEQMWRATIEPAR